MNKLLTIVIPAYNMEKYLDRCLSSLIVGDEKMQHLEVLVINDGSKDRTSEIAHTYEDRFPGTIRVVDKENGHYGSCVNRGLEEARGTFIKVLDADDYFCPDFESYLAYLKEADADLVLTDCVLRDDDGLEIDRWALPLQPGKPLSIRDLLESGISCLDHFRITYRTHLLKEMCYRQTEGISYTDLEWVSLPVCHVSSIVYLPKTIYCYIRGRAGQSVDIAYRKRNMWMENQVVLGLAQQFETLKQDLARDNASVFKSFVSFFVQTVYRHYLLLAPHDLNPSDLREFDAKLQQISEELYESVLDAKESKRFGTFCFIRDFREAGKRRPIKYLFYDSCMTLGSIINRIQQK